MKNKYLLGIFVYLLLFLVSCTNTSTYTVTISSKYTDQVIFKVNEGGVLDINIRDFDLDNYTCISIIDKDTNESFNITSKIYQNYNLELVYEDLEEVKVLVTSNIVSFKTIIKTSKHYSLNDICGDIFKELVNVPLVDSLIKDNNLSIDLLTLNFYVEDTLVSGDYEILEDVVVDVEINEIPKVLITIIDNVTSMSKSFYIYKGSKLDYTHSYYDEYNYIGLFKDELGNDKYLGDIVDEDITLYSLYEKTNDLHFEVIDSIIPDVVSDSIDLPRYYGDYILSYNSHNKDVISDIGVVNRRRNETEVIIDVIIYDNNKPFNYQKKVKVLPTKYKELIPGKTVFGYYSSWNFYGYNDTILDTLDVINLSFAYVNPDGSIDTTSFNTRIMDILTCHNRGVRVVLSVQGYGSEGVNFSTLSKTNNGRKTIALNMLEVVKKYNLDGIDIDWEYPGFNTGTSMEIDRVNYTLLCKEIKDTFDAYDETLLLTAAIPGGPYSPVRFELDKLTDILDYIHIMTYDLQSSSYATHHTALYPSTGTISGCTVKESVDYYLSQGVNTDKMIIGIAFYGKYATSNGLKESSSTYKTITYDEIESTYLNDSASSNHVYYDSAANASYILKDGIFITYDDTLSISAKINYVNSNNLGGVMIWEIGENKSLTLLNYIGELINA